MKVFVLKEEDLFSRDEYVDCCCSNTWTIIGVFSSKDKAQAVIDEANKNFKKMNMSYKRYFDIEEMELDK